jgi:hypothetical protein
VNGHTAFQAAHLRWPSFIAIAGYARDAGLLLRVADRLLKNG